MTTETVLRDAAASVIARWEHVDESVMRVADCKAMNERIADLNAALSRPASASEGVVEAFQRGVDKWMDACFNAEIKADVVERSDRFLEEALEFVQAAGYSADRAHALVDYTFGRPQGEINQEVGGVMVTLAAMCNTLGVDIGAAAETELARVWTKIDAIRAKQAAKPTGSALPIAALSSAPVDDREKP